MKQLDEKTIKEIQLRILDDVARFCEQNQLVYFLCGGTLLGAIRHKGYIPWDDDIDLMMPRKYYELLIKKFEHENLKLYSHDSVPDYNKPFVKIADTRTDLIEASESEYKIGINIDIFPIDGFPDDSASINKHLKKIKFYRNLLNLKYLKSKEGRSFYKELVLLLSKYFLYFIPGKSLSAKITTLSKKYKFDSCNKAGISVWGYGKKEICPRSVFEESIEVAFENKFYKAPEDYKTYLSNVYGSFMELPPAAKQVTHHDYKVYG